MSGNNKRLCRLEWQEQLDDDGEPVSLIGRARAKIISAADAAKLVTFEISGKPDTFNEQFDRALAGIGWRRIDDIRAWPGPSNGTVGFCVVARDEGRQTSPPEGKS